MEMNKMNTEDRLYGKRFTTTFSLLCMLTVVLIIVLGLNSSTVSSDSDVYVPSYYHEGWTQEIGDSSILLDDIQDYIPVEMGEKLIFTRTLSEISDGMVFLFYSNDMEVMCYVDDVLIQNFTMQEGLEFLKTPGSAWNQIDLDSSMTGKTCTLIFYSTLGDYESLCNIYFVENEYVNTVRVTYLWKYVTATCVLAFIMFVIVATSFVGQQSHRKRYLLSIAKYFFVIILWLCAEINIYDMIFSRPIISYLLGEFFVRMVPLALLQLARNSTNLYWHPKIFKVIVIIACLNLFVPFIVQFTFGISLLEMEIINYLVSTLTDGLLLYIIIEKIIYFKKLKYEEYPCIAVLILIVFGSLDNIYLISSTVYQSYFVSWTAIGCIIFSFVTLILLTYINSCIQRDKLEYEQLFNNLESVNLAKQLEVHFVFNVLNTISAFCKIDPEEADRLIRLFSVYLRSYLHLMNGKSNISVHKELELVRDYLKIQQIRFGDKLKFSFDTEYVDFEIPPFVVHTFVENSVLHGIKPKPQGGTIMISVKRENDIAKIIISDTGMGFDINNKTKKTSLGVSNAKRRLEIMRNGSIDISSNVGEGTTVEINVPI